MNPRMLSDSQKSAPDLGQRLEGGPRFLEETLELAARGVGQVSPNPAVGAVIVREDADGNPKVVGRGFHTWAGVKHAEVIAIEEAGELARGATLYLTLEPC